MNKNIHTQNETISPTPAQNAAPREEGLKVNGLQQVVDLLRNADPVFRESLLRRLTQRDPKLAQNLRKLFR